MMKTATSILILVATASGGSLEASAQSARLEGLWRGSGKVTLPSGAEENARCRVRYSRETATSYVADAICATSSARVSQSATLRQTGSNRYSGSFYNAEYGIEGSIRVVVQGSRQSVSLDGGGATAWLRLSR